MAPVMAAVRLSSRLAIRQLAQEVSARGYYRTSAASLAAHNFNMPALSPTMTEGSIATWRVKEGDSFSAGDVLLEIETDKATMDVEAQDDGIIAKIIQGDGSKVVKVGTRIAVIAEAGDDISSLEIPKEDAAPSSSGKAEDAGKPNHTEASPAQAGASTSPTSATWPSKDERGPFEAQKPQKQKYPLLPSVAHLLHEHGLDLSEADKIIPSGPNGRLLKGDVLAYLGSVPKRYPMELADKINKLTHLDLSAVKVAPRGVPTTTEAVPGPALEPEQPVIQTAEVALPISMAAVLEVQKKLENTLGVFLPLSAFIARATDVANDDLPRSKLFKPTADELFDAVLGLDRVELERSRGHFVPQVTALPSTAVATVPRDRTLPSTKFDIIDILAGKRVPTKPRRIAATPLPGPATTTNVISVTVPKGDEKRGMLFLERVKDVLEDEPGRLVI